MGNQVKGVRVSDPSVRRRGRNVCSAALAVGCVFLLGCGNGSETLSETREAALQPREVRLASLERRSFSRTVASTGSLIPRQQASIKALADGPLVQLPVDIGDSVSRGDTLFQVRETDARLAWETTRAARERAKAALAELLAWRRAEEVSLLEAQVARARSEADRLERELERHSVLLEKGAISQSVWDQVRTSTEVARNDLRVAEENLRIAQAGPTEEGEAVARRVVEEAEAAVAAARQRLDDTRAEAPFAGVVTGRHHKIGDYVSRGDAVVDLANLAYLEAEMKIPERYAGLVTPGVPVELRVDSLNESRTAEIIAVNQSIDLATRTFLIKVGLDNPELNIKSGSFCTGILELPSRENVVTVPVEAVGSREGSTFVWVVEDGRARRTPVQLGERDNGSVAVLAGLTGDERVVVDGGGALSEGDPVTEGPGKTAQQ